MVEMVVTITISLRVPEEEVDEVIGRVMSNLKCEVLDVEKYPESEFVEVTADFCEVSEGGEVVEGRLYMIEEFEDWEVLITDEDLYREDVLGRVGLECRCSNEHIFCGAVKFHELSELGVRIYELLKKYHGRRVRMKIEVIE